MRVYRCGKVDYPEGQIFSLDLHPNGRLLATCGSDGKGNGLLAIWDISPYIDGLAPDKLDNDSLPSENDMLPSPPKKSTDTGSTLMIAQHRLLKNCQNCVRWSRFDGGRWLVGAGDNSILHIYEPLKEDGSYSFDGAVSLLGHKLEILHADFSKDGKYLASCSLDNTIIIWNMEELPSKVVILSVEHGGHTDYVTGLAWDPAERFLATQSSDNTLKIWRCENWECEQTIEGPFVSSLRSSLYTRLDWTSDGAFLIGTCSMNNEFHTAKVILRRGFDFDRDLVGFRRMVTCVRSNDLCIDYKDSSENRIVSSLVAVGSMDRSISIWLLPAVSRPLCVIRNLFPEAILDMSWHTTMLTAIGVNGSVRCIFFDEKELGTFLTGAKMCQHFETMYNYVPTAFRTYLPKTTVQSDVNWVDQTLKDVFIPSADLIKTRADNHELLGHQEDTPRCATCSDNYNWLMVPLDEQDLKEAQEKLAARRITKEPLNRSTSSVSDLSDH